MRPFSKKHRFPGVEENPDGTINFSLTDDEARKADRALEMFKGYDSNPPTLNGDVQYLLITLIFLSSLLTDKYGIRNKQRPFPTV